jgi:hypothetical protein
MRRSSRRAAAALAIFAALTALAAGCGSPLSATDVTATAQARAGTAGTSAATPIAETPIVGAAAATATALFENTNRKLAQTGEPTLAPGTDPLHPFASVTYAPEPPNTPGPSPTPPAPSCGATIAGWADILAQYGPMPENRGCAPYATSVGTQLVITTEGVNGGPGAIATYTCQPADSSCLRGEPPQAPDAAWSVFPAPYTGGVGIAEVGDTSPDILILLGGRCFNLATDAYDLNPGCH